MLDTELFDLMKLFAFARASLTIVHGGVHGFRVTPKSHAASKSWHPFLMLVGLLGVLYVGALWIGLARLAGLGLEAANPAATAAAVVWGTAVLTALVFVRWQVYRHFTKRRAYPLDVRINAILRHDQLAAWAIARDLIMLGAAVDSAVAIESGTAVRLELDGMARGCCTRAARMPVSTSSRPAPTYLLRCIRRTLPSAATRSSSRCTSSLADRTHPASWSCIAI